MYINSVLDPVHRPINDTKHTFIGYSRNWQKHAAWMLYNAVVKEIIWESNILILSWWQWQMMLSNKVWSIIYPYMIYL